MIKADLVNIMTALHTLSHAMHDESFTENNEVLEKQWEQGKAMSIELKCNVDSARGLLYPDAFTPYSTPYDAVLSMP